MPPPRLPLELECHIFETAARDYRDHLKSAQVINLSLVARRVHFWVEPVFLEVIVLLDIGHAEKFLEFVDMKPQGFFANVVRALCIRDDRSVDAKITSRIVAACSGVRMLACWAGYEDGPDLPLLISRLPLTRLDIESDYFLAIPFDTCTWLSTLTHLCLRLNFYFDDSLILSPLGRLPSLIHLTLPPVEISFARALCSSYPNLQIVLRVGAPLSEYDLEEIREEVREYPRIVLSLPTTHGDGDYRSEQVLEWLRNLP
ncbi:hypothetical protein C8J57DRAFT_338204 [Mycena rebaudengoi]|nr:hypothetical protein C8J57DRAFT_338204 [Mycena rebaudengoi]